ncbi:MAG: hypothetical protein L6Q99_12210 [Planctomycetes bacterium]|nr:hypothetical protein [Planctomycetota bacterium]
MIDIGSETLVPLAQVARNFPAPESKRGLDVRVLHRWAHKGLRGVRLDVVRKDGVACTTYESIARFLEALADKLEGSGDVQPLRWHSADVRSMLARVRQERPADRRRGMAGAANRPSPEPRRRGHEGNAIVASECSQSKVAPESTT